MLITDGRSQLYDRRQLLTLHDIVGGNLYPSVFVHFLLLIILNGYRLKFLLWGLHSGNILTPPPPPSLAACVELVLSCLALTNFLTHASGWQSASECNVHGFFHLLSTFFAISLFPRTHFLRHGMIVYLYSNFLYPSLTHKHLNDLK
jgi:hypothetical protein